MKLERLLKNIEHQLALATEANNTDALFRLTFLLSDIRKERIEELERQISKAKQTELKLKLVK